MARRTKSVHNIVINECNIQTRIDYNTNTNHMCIGTTHSYRKNYRENTKDKQKEYSKFHGEKNKDRRSEAAKIRYENNRDPDMPRIGSKECAIKISCAKQGINIKDFDGFLTDQLYCSKFNNKLRRSIRDRYNNCDYISGIHKDVCNPDRKLSVHHVNYDKDCGCDGNKCELIPLSHVNHMRTNTNRPFWNRLFTYSLQYDETYNSKPLRF